MIFTLPALHTGSHPLSAIRESAVQAIFYMKCGAEPSHQIVNSSLVILALNGVHRELNR